MGPSLPEQLDGVVLTLAELEPPPVTAFLGALLRLVPGGDVQAL